MTFRILKLTMISFQIIIKRNPISQIHLASLSMLHEVVFFGVHVVLILVVVCDVGLVEMLMDMFIVINLRLPRRLQR